jgi:hypothetical protein
MFPTKTKTLTQPPQGGGVHPPKINKNGVGESDIVYMGERLYYVTQEAYDRIKYNRPTVRTASKDKTFKALSALLLVSNTVTLAVANDRIFEKVILTLAFGIICAVMLMALKNISKPVVKNEPTPEPKPTRQLNEKEMHKKKTALAMLRQLEA